MGKWNELYRWVNEKPGNWVKVYRLPGFTHASVEVGWLDDSGVEVSVRTTVSEAAPGGELSDSAAGWALAAVCEKHVTLVEAVAAGADRTPAWRICCDKCYAAAGFALSKEVAASRAAADGWKLEDGGNQALCPDCLNDEA